MSATMTPSQRAARRSDLGVRPGADRPDRDARSLDGPRVEVQLLHPVVSSAVAHRLAGPGQLQNVEALVELLGTNAADRILGADSRVASVPRPAQADRQDEAPVRQVVDRDRLPRHLPWTATRQREDHGTQRDALRDRGHRAEHDPGVEDIAALDRDVVPGEYTIPAAFLGLAGHLDIVICRTE